MGRKPSKEETEGGTRGRRGNWVGGSNDISVATGTLVKKQQMK